MSEEFKVRMKMHLNRGSNGHGYVWELVDYPDVTVVENFDKKTRTSKRVIIFGEDEFPTLQAAVDAYRSKKGEVNAART